MGKHSANNAVCTAYKIARAVGEEIDITAQVLKASVSYLTESFVFTACDSA